MTKIRNTAAVLILIALFYFSGFIILTKIPPVAKPASNSTKESSPSVFSAMVAKNEGPFYKVVKVVDGDTFDVDINGQTERVRLIGIDAPESVSPQIPIECFGNEASQKLTDLLTGKSVSLESDFTQLNKDKYSRLLRYVFLEDGTNVNEQMIKEGYAYEYTYNKAYIYQQSFKTAQVFAQGNKLGLWGVCE